MPARAGGTMKRRYYEEYITVNGIREYLLHYPAGPEDPVILHLHGGPGASEAFFAYLVEEYPRKYSIVYYDQRKSGRTFLKNPFAGGGIRELKQDLLETVLYLKKKYGKEKICVLGHSWGAVLGSLFVLEHPEHVQCYIGCGQFCSFVENEKAAYAFLAEAVRRSGDKSSEKKLKRIGRYPDEVFGRKAMLKIGRIRFLQARYGLAAALDEKAAAIFRNSPVTRFYDWIPLVFGGLFSAGLMKELWNLDLREKGYDYQVPVYYVTGDRDRTTPFEEALKYFERIQAPLKEWRFVSGAGHFAMLDNTEAFRKILGEIAAGYRQGKD